MPTLALDTATPAPSLAILEGPETLAELWLAPRRGSGRRVLEAAHHLMRAAGVEAGQLEAVVVGVGPGGFTGLRIGIATALGLGQALGVPVRGALTLEALALGIAEGVPEGAVVAPAIDARRREVFAAAYRTGAGGLEELMPPTALAPAALGELLAVHGAPVWAGGDGVAAHPAAFAAAPFRPLPEGAAAHRVRAAHLAARVAVGAGRPAVPVYARLPDAEVNRRAEAPL